MSVPARAASWKLVPSLTESDRRCLVFHLTGPMEGWGTVAVGTFRPTRRHPTKSAIVGVVSASLGFERDDARIHSLFVDYEYAVISSGKETEMSDFATVESSEPDKGELFTRLPPRALELSSEKRNTIMVDRRFICNGYFTVLMVPKTGAEFSLESIKAALECPHFVPYLGRKSCPLSFPMCPSIESYSRLCDIIPEVSLRPFRNDAFQDSKFLKNMDAMRVYSTYPLEGFGGYVTNVVVDDMPDRINWSFRERIEYEYLGELR